jgi:hypothetical protein
MGHLQSASGFAHREIGKLVLSDHAFRFLQGALDPILELSTLGGKESHHLELIVRGGNPHPAEVTDLLAHVVFVFCHPDNLVRDPQNYKKNVKIICRSRSRFEIVGRIHRGCDRFEIAEA